MEKSFVLCLLLVWITVATHCGGNCPDDSCMICPCGLQKHQINIEEFCNSYKGWDADCCMCIIKMESGGNAHFMRR
jgi:hypothetical protein